MRKYIYTILILSLFFITGLNADIPRTLSYQGVLTDTLGNIKPDGDYNMSFNLYLNQSGGQPIWSESKMISIKDGLFYTILGEVNPIVNSITFSNQYWLGIAVGNDPELKPRLKLSSVAYSFYSIHADTAEYARNAPGAVRPISPPINSNEIANNTVVRNLRIYPVPQSDSMSIMRDNVYLVGGNNISIRQYGDSVIIHSGIGDDTTAHNTLDKAYDEGGPGNGRAINSDIAPVDIIGDFGLQVTGTQNVLKAYTDAGIAAGDFSNLGIDGPALIAQITDPTNFQPAISGISNGNSSSVAVYGIATGEGPAGFFEVQNATNSETALIAGGLGEGKAFRAYIYNDKSSAAEIITLNSTNDKPSLFVENEGTGSGIYSISGEYSGIYAGNAGVLGSSKSNIGVIGTSNSKSGVFGQSDTVGTFNNLSGIVAGVLGHTNNISTADNFAVAGVASGYGTGVLGIGSSAGHGVFGVSGANSKYTSAGIRGVTREDSLGQFFTWPPYFPLEEYLPNNKDRVGVLGQAVKKVGVWGESLYKYGVVGNTGKVLSWTDLPVDSAGVIGLANQSMGIGVLGTSEEGNAAKFYIDNELNTETALLLLSNSKKGVLRAEHSGKTGNAVKIWSTDTSNISPALWVETSGENESVYLYGKKNTSFRPSLFIQNETSGHSAYMINKYVSNQNPVLSAYNDGSGRSGEFVTRYANNSSTVLYAATQGLGRAGEFSSFNINNNTATFYSYQKGIGRAGEYRIENSSNTSNVLYASTDGLGRVGEFNIFNGTSTAASLYSSTTGRGNAGIFAINNGSNSVAALIVTSNGSGDAFYSANTGTGRAGYFVGNVVVSGILTKSGGNFMIDHPLDPENKYLNHSFVESPDMKNIYDGVIILDENGLAEVELDDWFEALNMDFRYQLTAIGVPAPNLYISKEVEGNKFAIAGGKPGLKVSWQLTGIRKDPFANANRIQVEMEKPDNEKGKYMHPELYGFDKSKSIKYESNKANYSPKVPDNPSIETIGSEK